MFKFVLLFTLLVAGTSAFTTCLGNCGVNDGTTDQCQCNTVCSDYGDCCSDYTEYCYTCANNRCGEDYLYSRPCQCNVDCPDHSNCCADFDLLCQGFTSPPDIGDAIMALTEELFTLDVNSVGTKYTVDLSPPGPLFIATDPDLLNGPTISTMVALRDNYFSDTTVVESDDATEAAEKEAFLDAIMATAVMARTEEFMFAYNLIPNYGSLREAIDEIFFTYYTRAGGPMGSNGFEHSFLGEIDDGQVKGYHNWISWYLDEADGEINYDTQLGYLDISDDVDGVLMMEFDWTQEGSQYHKPISSMWMGTSPELELASYTVCFFAYPSQLCDVSMNGVAYRIQTYTQASEGLTLVGSAYPDIP